MKKVHVISKNVAFMPLIVCRVTTDNKQLNCNNELEIIDICTMYMRSKTYSVIEYWHPYHYLDNNDNPQLN